VRRKLSKGAALRIRLKRALVAAGMAGLASRRVIRGIIVMLGLERA
jgi:hypothetical protein